MEWIYGIIITSCGVLAGTSVCFYELLRQSRLREKTLQSKYELMLEYFNHSSVDASELFDDNENGE